MKPIVKGLFKHLPFAKRLFPSKTGGASLDSKYCYAVWLRHLKNWADYNDKPAKVVAELGPGNSLGICFAALLSGTEKVYALDVVKYWDVDVNLRIFKFIIINQLIC